MSIDTTDHVMAIVHTWWWFLQYCSGVEWLVGDTAIMYKTLNGWVEGDGVLCFSLPDPLSLSLLGLQTLPKSTMQEWFHIKLTETRWLEREIMSYSCPHVKLQQAPHNPSHQSDHFSHVSTYLTSLKPSPGSCHVTDSGCMEKYVSQTFFPHSPRRWWELKDCFKIRASALNNHSDWYIPKQNFSSVQQVGKI